MGWECQGCAHKRAHLRWPSCKGERLCHQFDFTLVSLFPRRTRDDYRAIHERIALDATDATRWAHDIGDGSAPLPSLSDFVREAHSILLCELGPRAGVFRNEPVKVGGEGAHAFDGEGFATIAQRMHELAQSAPWPSPDVTRSELVRWAARFLVRYFRIHPFIDGNGRTGRLVLEVAAKRSGRMRFTWTRPERKAKQRRAYLHALQYAHQHGQHSDRPRRNALAHLERWLDAHLSDVTNDDDEP